VDIYLKNVASLRFDEQKCTRCGMCIKVCPRLVFEMQKSLMITDKDRCIECGACMLNCPEAALWVDAGVGCASAMISGAIKGKQPECGCCS